MIETTNENQKEKKSCLSHPWIDSSVLYHTFWNNGQEGILRYWSIGAKSPFLIYTEMYNPLYPIVTNVDAAIKKY